MPASDEGAATQGRVVASGLEEATEDGVPVIALVGEHDVYTAPRLRELLSAQLEPGQPVIVDLERSTFIDSSILGVLLGAVRRASDHDTGFAIVLGDDGDPAVHRILDVTGLLRVLPIAATRREAATRVRAAR